MGLGRRCFLKMFSAVVASAASNPVKSFAIENDLYVNYKLGFACRKPRGWDFAFAYEFGELVHGPHIESADHATMKEIAKCAGHGTDGMLVVSGDKLVASHKHIGPHVYVIVDYDPTFCVESWDSEDAQTYADGFRDEVAVSKSYPPAELVRVSNCDGVRFGYEFVTWGNGLKYEWSIDQLIISQGSLAYIISMLNASRAPKQFSYDAFVDSIRIA